MMISSLSFNAATRTTILKLQNELNKANAEVGTGRHADVGLALGRLTGEAVRYQSQASSIGRMLDSNKLVTTRLEMMDDTMAGLTNSAQSLSSSLTTMLSTTGNAVGVTAVVDTAKASMQSMIGALNINVTGQYLFAGAQTDQMPMKDGSSQVADGFNAFLQAVGTATGTTVTAANVSPEVMEAYLGKDGYTAGGTTYKFDDLFADGASWDAWSNASDTPVVSRITKNETLDSSLSTNETAFRKLTAAYSLLTNAGLGEMSAETRSVVAKAALTRVNEGISGLTSLTAEVGTRINRVELANTSLTAQKKLVDESIDRLEGVDYAEATLRVTTLETQLKASYEVTGRLSGLSLLNYL
ncbi:flagellar hook-associated family protein [Aureimonas sp. ME7]|uniref:flagellar hook-associated family protein n=1 Tax=Aureimonas sp. ME7 TaxID=2744252 RepID=UPI0015F4A8A0|nr:flagellar hook-associated family protein [Aureimonas sp. ME7]